MSKNTSPVDKSEAKKAAVLGRGAGNRRLPLLLSLAIAAVLFAGGFLLLGKKGGEAIGTPAVAATEASGSEVSFPVSQFADGKAKFYKLDTGPVVIRYFLVKGSDGGIRSAFDTCDSCWRAGKGYEQSGDLMVCRNCSLKFPIKEIGLVHGGCNPVPVKSEVRDGKVVMRVADLQAGREYFDLTKKG